MNHNRDFARGFARAKRFARLAAAGGVALSLAACQETENIADVRAYHPIPQATLDLMAKDGTTETAPMLIRTFKKEAEFEVWKMGSDGRYAYIKTFPMCRWSGQLGPKTREGDRQVPEGFYSIAPGQMNPNSHYYLSFNVGYPNAFDRAHGDTGGDIMVHGICSSAGCFSMTNEQMDEIYAIAREAFAGGQREIQMESFPFRMTAENLAKYRYDPNMPFWKQLKEGADYFKATRQEPRIGVCGRHYVFDKVPVAGRLDPAEPCPALKDANPEVAAAVQAEERQDDLQVAALVAKGVQAVHLVYRDGGQNPEFADRVPDVSRPDALAAGPTEVPITASGKPVVVAKAPVNLLGAGRKPSRLAAGAGKTTRVADADQAPTPGRAKRQSVVKGKRGAPLQEGAIVVTATAASPPASPPPPPTAPKTGPAPFYRRWFSLVNDRLTPGRASAAEGSQQQASAP